MAVVVIGLWDSGPWKDDDVWLSVEEVS